MSMAPETECPTKAVSVVAFCCINSAAMLQIADGEGHSPEKLARFRDLNEKQARQLFAAALIADEMLAALRAVVSDILEYERVNNLAPNPGRNACWDSVTRARAAIAKATGAQP